MFDGCSRNRDSLLRKNGFSDTAIEGRLLRNITVVVLLSGVLFASACSLLNAYRASYGCGEYSVPFNVFWEIIDAASLGIPILLIAAFFRSVRSGIIGSIVTLLVAIFWAGFSAYFLVDDTLTHYSPCDRKGDEHSFFMFLTELLILLPWFLLYWISIILEPLETRLVSFIRSHKTNGNHSDP